MAADGAPPLTIFDLGRQIAQTSKGRRPCYPPPYSNSRCIITMNCTINPPTPCLWQAPNQETKKPRLAIFF